MFNQKQVRTGNPINRVKVPNQKTKSYTRKLTRIDMPGRLTRKRQDDLTHEGRKTQF